MTLNSLSSIGVGISGCSKQAAKKKPAVWTTKPLVLTSVFGYERDFFFTLENTTEQALDGLKLLC